MYSIPIILIIGALVGFLSGLLGKGGSAISTPSLQLFARVNPFAALASPLPASLPTTLSAAFAYKNENLVSRKVVIQSILCGIPATLYGSWLSGSFKGHTLMVFTALFVLAIGLSFFMSFSTHEADPGEDAIPFWKIFVVAVGVGFLSGILANSGGILFGPLFIRFLKLPTKKALASSLIVSAGLAIPGTLEHWYLGHINWSIVLFLSVSSIPFSYLGAKVAINMDNKTLERVFAVMLIGFGIFDLIYNI